MSKTSITFKSNPDPLASLNDVDFLKAIRWAAGTDPAIVKAAESGSTKEFAACSQKALRGQLKISKAEYRATALWSRQAFPEEAELFPLLEGAIGSQKQGESRRPANKTTRPFAQRIEKLVYALTSSNSSTPHSGLLALTASLELLAVAGANLDPIQYWKLWRQTLTRTLHSLCNADSTDPTVPSDIQLIERGEIPAVAGLIFRNIADASQMATKGRAFLKKKLIDGTDTDGTPHAEFVERLTLWLAPYVRAMQLSQACSGSSIWTEKTNLQFKYLTERAIPLCRPDGRAALSNGLKLEPLPILVAAAEVCGLPPMGSVGAYLQSVMRITVGKSPRRAQTGGVCDMPSNQSDFARLALLRSDWTVNADSVALAHHRRFPQLDVTAAGKPLFHGDWSLDLQIGGTPVELADEWQCVCWQSDVDADYIELQMCGPKGMRVERIAMLSRKQRFLLLADSVSGIPNKKIEYSSSLPIPAGVTARADTPTREVQLVMKGLKSRIFPLAVEQDRVLSTPHELIAQDGFLTLKQTVTGEGLFAPIIFDWEPSRAKQPAVWRTLTVAEEGEYVRNNSAAGYRLKVGNVQLLVYRSLKANGNSRTVLGHHTRCETVIARVDKKGDIDPILTVE